MSTTAFKNKPLHEYSHVELREYLAELRADIRRLDIGKSALEPSEYKQGLAAYRDLLGWVNDEINRRIPLMQKALGVSPR